MKSDWNSESLDELMAELDRMEQNRGTATSTPLSREQAQDILREVDAVLGLDSDSLLDFSVLPETPVPTTPKAEDVVVSETRFGQEKFEAPEPEEIFSGRESEEPDMPEVPSFMPGLRVADTEPAKESDEDMKIAEPVKEPAEDIKIAEPLKAFEPDDGKTKVFSTSAPVTEEIRSSSVTPPPPPPMPDDLYGQIVFPGYEEQESVPTIDEKKAEEELNRRRSDTVRDFRLLGGVIEHYEQDLPPETDIFKEEEPSAPQTEDEKIRYNGPEYIRQSERNSFFYRLAKERRAGLLQMGLLTLLELVMVILSIVTGKAETANRAILYAVNMVPFAVAIAVSFTDLLNGITDLIHKKPSGRTAVTLVTLVAFIQGVVAVILPGSEGIPGTFCAAAGLALLLGKVNKFAESYSTMNNFKLCAMTAADHLHTIRAFRDKKDSFEVGKNLKLGDPKILYTEKTKFPTDFMRNSDYRTTTDRLCKFMIPAAVGVSLAAALGGWISTKVGLSALTAFTGAMCISMPACAAVVSVVPIVLTMLHVNRFGGMVVSPDSASVAAATQALAMDILDLYRGKDCDLGFEDYHTIRRDEMLMYAATMAFSSGSPISGALRETFPDEEFLPQVKSLIYEEKLGISGYIHGQSVLLGNRNLLINHSVEAPPKSVELRHLSAKKKVLYLAVGNKVAAMFIVSYKPDLTLKAPLKVLEKNGVHALVYSPDSNLQEDAITRGFGLKQGEVTVMSPAGGVILRDRSEKESENAPAGLMHNGTPAGMLRTMAGALTINNIQRIGAFVSIIGCGIGWLISFILMLVQGISSMNWGFICLYTLVWVIIGTGLNLWQMYANTKK